MRKDENTKRYFQLGLKMPLNSPRRAELALDEHKAAIIRGLRIAAKCSVKLSEVTPFTAWNVGSGRHPAAAISAGVASEILAAFDEEDGFPPARDELSQSFRKMVRYLRAKWAAEEGNRQNGWAK